MIGRALAAIAHLGSRRPYAVGAGVVLVTTAALALLPRLRVSPDVESLLPEGSELVDLYRDFGPSATASRDLFLLLEGTELEARLGGLIERLEASPYLESVSATVEDFLGEARESLLEAPLYFLTDEQLRELERALAPEARRAAIEESRLVLTEDPFGGRELVLRDPLGLRWTLEEAARSRLPAALSGDSPYLLLEEGTLALVAVRGFEEPTLVETSRALLADVEQRLAGEDVAFFGGYATARADASRIARDIERSTIASVLLVFAFLAISTRSLVAPHLFLLPVCVAVVWTLAFGGALLGPLTPLAISASAILTGLGVDFSIHFAERYGEARAGADHDRAVLAAGVHTGRASLLALLTSNTAFLCFAAGSFPELRKFGVLLAMGLTFAFVLTLLLYPILVRLFPSGRLRPVPSAIVATARRITSSRAGRPVAIALVCIAGLGWVQVARSGVEFDADPARLRPADDPGLETAGRIQRALGFSPLPLQVLVPSERPAADVAAACERLERGDLVAFSSGAHTLVPSPERRERVARFRAATRGWVAATLADLERAGFEPGPFRDHLESWGARFAAHPAPPTDEERVFLEGRSYRPLALYARGDLADRERRSELHAAIAAALEGAVILDPHGLAEVVQPILAAEFRRAMGFTVLGVVLWTLVFVRSARAACLALLPVTAGFGLLGLLTLAGVALHPGNLIAIPLLLGLGVDDGVHLVLRRMEGTTDPLATTGPAVWRTSGTNALAFGSLITATSPAIASMGLLVLVGVAATLVTSLLVLPAFWQRDLGSIAS